MHPSSCFAARLNRSAKGRNSLFQGSAQSDLTRVRVYRGFIYGCRCSVTLRYQSKSKIAASAAFHGLTGRKPFPPFPKKRPPETRIGPERQGPGCGIAAGRFFCPIRSKESHFVELSDPMLPNKSRGIPRVARRKVRKVNGPERTHGLQGRSEGNLPDLRPLSRTKLQSAWFLPQL
jgi:hypothetical protein